MTCENREGRRSSSVQCTQCVRIYWEHMVSAVPKMGVLIVLLATRTISFRIRGLKQYLGGDGIDQINFSKWSKQRRESSGTHIYSTFYYIVVQFQVLWILSLKHVSPMHSSAAQPKKNLLISKPGKRSLSLQNTHFLSLSPPWLIYPNFYCFNLRKLS